MLERMRSRRVRLLAGGLAIVAVVAAVATGAALLAPRGGPSATPTAGATATLEGPVTIRWFVGLDNGALPDRMQAESDFARRFNQSQSEIVLQALPTGMSAQDELQLMIAQGDAPDVLGPIGMRSVSTYRDSLLDLGDQIEKQGYDLGQFDPQLLSMLDLSGAGQIGLPYQIAPAFMFYNKDLFAKANLPSLPKRVGQTYNGDVWDWNNLAKTAAQLTLDDKGRTAADPGFDPAHIVQWGVDFQWWDARRLASAFGGGSSVANDGRTAQIPDAWREAWHWYYDAIWTRHIAPTAAQIDSDLLGHVTTIGTGRIAMSATNPWTIDSYYSIDYSTDFAGVLVPPAFKGWDMAVMPSWKGQTTGPLDMDTFAVGRTTAHPSEAFRVVLAMMADPELMRVYGDMPAAPGLRAAWYSAQDAELADVFPGNKVTWSVLDEMAKHPALPSPESAMPNFYQALAVYGNFFSKIQGSPGLDPDVEIDFLQATLQTAFDKAP